MKSLQTLLCRAITAHVFIFHSEYLMVLLPGNKKQNEFKQKSLQKYTYLSHFNVMKLLFSLKTISLKYFVFFFLNMSEISFEYKNHSGNGQYCFRRFEISAWITLRLPKYWVHEKITLSQDFRLTFKTLKANL